MSIVALADVLNAGVMRDRFHAEPIVRATELLLQERTPRDVLVARPRAEEVTAASKVRELIPPLVRRFSTPHDAIPRTQLLSNGRYSVMLTSAGSGYSRWRDLAITRWREDLTFDDWGQLYLSARRTIRQCLVRWLSARRHRSRRVRSHFLRRSRRNRPPRSLADHGSGSGRFLRRRRGSPPHLAQQLGIRARDIQVTSYAELSLTPQAADVAHPAFAKLFVETEFVPDVSALVATRRKRSEDETSVWVAHVLVTDAETVGELQFETDRARFVGRTRTLRDPVSVMDGRPLSNTVGSVLDPILSLRRTVRVPAGHNGPFDFFHDCALARAKRSWISPTNIAMHEPSNAPTRWRGRRRRCSCTTWASLPRRRFYSSAWRTPSFTRIHRCVPPSDVLARSSLDISTLWAQGISGDLPIILARIDDPDDVDIIRQMLRAHEYWRMKQLSADVVIINEKAASYVQELQDSLESLVRGSQLRLSPDSGGVSGKIFLLRGDLSHARRSRAVASRGACCAVEPARHAGRTDCAIPISGTRGAYPGAAGTRRQIAGRSLAAANFAILQWSRRLCGSWP